MPGSGDDFDQLRDHGPEVDDIDVETRHFLLKELRGRQLFWHRIPLSGFREVQKSGAIMPNTGQYNSTYPQSRGSFGRSIGAVSLFDFDSRSVDEIMDQAHNWAAFFVDQGPATIVIGIDSKKLEVDKIHRDCDSTSACRIPMVEIWHKGSVKTDAFDDILLIRGDGGFRSGAYSHFASDDLEGVVREAERLISAKESERVERHARGVFSFPELVAMSIDIRDNKNAE